MTTSLSVPAFIETILGKVPPAVPGDSDSVEAVLLAQANALAELFKHLLVTAFSHPEGIGKGSLVLRLALRAQMQSGRFYQQLLRNKSASRKATGGPARSRKSRNAPLDPDVPLPLDPPASVSGNFGTIPQLPENPEPVASSVEESMVPALPLPGPCASPVPNHQASPPPGFRTALLEAAASFSSSVQNVPDPAQTAALQSALESPENAPAIPELPPPAKEPQSLLDVFPLANAFPRLAHIFGREEDRATGSPSLPLIEP